MLQFTNLLGLSQVVFTKNGSANVLKTVHIDGGTKISMFNGAMLPVEARDSKGALVLNVYDELLRPLRLWARVGYSLPAGFKFFFLQILQATPKLLLCFLNRSHFRATLYAYLPEIIRTKIIAIWPGNTSPRLN